MADTTRETIDTGAAESASTRIGRSQIETRATTRQETGIDASGAKLVQPCTLSARPCRLMVRATKGSFS